MAINADPEIPKNINAQLGVDHSDNVIPIRTGVAIAAGVPIEQVTPTIEQEEERAQRNVDDYLDKMGAKPEAVPEPKKVSDEGLTFINPDINAFNPFDTETDRFGEAGQPRSEVEERKAKMGFQEEKEAA